MTPIHDRTALITQLPQFDPQTVQNLADVNRGREGSHMKTLGLIRTVDAEHPIQIKGTTIEPAKGIFPIDLELESANPSYIEVPEHLEFEAKWDNTPVSNKNNILGNNGRLFLKESSLPIPSIKATPETLAYYGAVLIPENTAVLFPNQDPFPLWKMDVGQNYVQDVIMNENEAGGFYLEFHHDQPHFHMVLEGGGHYLLAKEAGPNKFHLTAFELSKGQAVYTKKGAIHCDAALTGELICGYSMAKECETVLLRTEDGNKMVDLQFRHFVSKESTGVLLSGQA